MRLWVSRNFKRRGRRCYFFRKVCTEHNYDIVFIKKTFNGMALFLLFIQGSPGTSFLPVVNSPALKYIYFVELFLSRNRLPTNIGSATLTLCTLFQILWQHDVWFDPLHRRHDAAPPGDDGVRGLRHHCGGFLHSLRSRLMFTCFNFKISSLIQKLGRNKQTFIIQI